MDEVGTLSPKDNVFSSVEPWMAQRVIPLNTLLSRADTHNSGKIKSSVHFAEFSVSEKTAYKYQKLKNSI